MNNKNEFYDGYNSKTKAFWETCEDTFAHLEIKDWLKSYDDLTKYWDDEFISKLDFVGKTVMDYGIGGGYLGKYLLTDKGLGKYYGVDISERSIEKARENLLDYENSVKLLNSEENWDACSCDIFISQACVQHFPGVEYLNQFLKKINTQAPSYIILQIRYSVETYSNPNCPIYSLLTNFNYIKDILKGFNLVYTSSVEDNGYQFGIFANKNIRSELKESISLIPSGFYAQKYFNLRSDHRELIGSYKKMQKEIRKNFVLSRGIKKIKRLFRSE
jgi:SAM-dependent methyltransferase